MKKLIFILMVGSLFGQNLPPQSEIIKMTTSEKMMLYDMNKKSPALAVFYSLMLPSSGHAYSGNWGKGTILGISKLTALAAGISSLGRSDMYYFDKWDYSQDDPEYSKLEEKEHYYGNMASYLIITSIVLHIYEVIDSGIKSNQYNKILYKSIYSNTPPSMSFKLQPTYQGANLTMSYSFK